MRIDRLLAITVMLLNRDRISAKKLADYFEVSIRTIYRDIDAINMAGIPIISFPGNNGGFGILSNYKLDRQMLSLNDMISILSVLKGINETFEDKKINLTLEKLTSLIPADKKNEVYEHYEQFVIDILPWGYRDREKKQIKILQNAISDSRLLEICYRNYNGISSKRIIEPMTILFKGYAWYLFAFCRKKTDYRVFRVSRISNAVMLDEKFIRKNKSYAEFIKTDEKSQNLVKLTLKFSTKARPRIDDFFTEEQMEIQQDGSIIVNDYFNNDEWLYHTILSYGENVEVLSPLEVRNKIKEILINSLNNYQP